jgi:transporter family protein
VAWAIIGLRLLLIGCERVLLRMLGQEGNPLATSVVFFGIGSLVLLPIAHPWNLAQWGYLWWAVPSGLLYAVAYLFYVSALGAGEVSTTAPLGSLTGIFVMLAAYLAFGEPLGWIKGTGALLITAGAVLLQPGQDLRASLLSLSGPGPGRWMVLYALVSAGTRILDKGASGSGAPPAAYACTVFAVVAITQAVSLIGGGGGSSIISLLHRQPSLSLAAGACNGLSFLLLMAALRHWPVSVAEPLTALSLLVSAGLAAWLLGERIAPRIGPTAAIIIGGWLIAASGPPAAQALANHHAPMM